MIQQISTFCNISQWIDANTLSFWSIIIGLIGIITTILAIFGFKIVLPHTRKWRKEQIEDIPDDFWGYYPNKNYIQPYFTFVDTRDNNPQLLRDYFLKKVFIKDTAEPKIYCLLGDTGTGKTAALVHLYADYIHSHSAKSPYHIKILSFREDKAFENINEIQDKKRCILLLDAMDESPMAQNSTQRSDFDKAINEVCKNFAFVIITCRPQFFSDDKTESEKVRVQKGYEWFPYTRLRLSDFNNIQVQKYLDNVFPHKSDNLLHQKAEELVNKNALIAIRPLVLTYIKDIIESNNEINTTLDLYDTIVQRWIQRELKRTNPDNLEERTQLWWNLTSEIAQYIYQNRTSKYKAPNISEDELISICKKQDTIDFKVFLSSQGNASNASPLTILNEENIHQRTMLTRTGDIFHFSHKSFYEYFMAYRFLQHPEEIKQVYGMDFALQIYNDALQAWSEQKDSPFAVLKNTHPYTVAISLNRVGNSLNNINHFDQAEPYFQLALNRFRQLEKEKNDTYKDGIAMVLNNLAILHRNTNQLDKAEEEYNKALTIRRQLADKNPDAFLPYVANTLNNLAILHKSTNQLDKAEEEYNEALTTYRQLADNNPDAYLPDVAMTLNNLAILHKNTNQLDKAEEEYNEALTTYRQLADKNPNAYLPYVAGTLNNIAVLHRNTNQLDKAEEEYNEALTTYRQLADKNPDAYLPDVAMTLNNLANLHRDTNQLDKAEEEYNEALTIRRQLADKNPDAYLPYVAGTLENLANLHSDTDRLQDAEEEYKDVLNIRQKLADKYPDAYLHKVAQTFLNMALLHLARKEYPAAEAAAQESLEKYRIMAEKSHAAFDKDVKDAEELLEYIRKAK